MASKSPDAFRTISEVAEELDIKQHVLRFWESKFPQVKPVKRAGGRRYYRPDDVLLLRRIRDLLYQDGYTIKGVQKLLKDFGPKAVAAGAANGAREGAGDDLFSSQVSSEDSALATTASQSDAPAPQSQFQFDQPSAATEGRTLGRDAVGELRGILVELREMKALLSDA